MKINELEEYLKLADMVELHIPENTIYNPHLCFSININTKFEDRLFVFFRGHICIYKGNYVQPIHERIDRDITGINQDIINNIKIRFDTINNVNNCGDITFNVSDISTTNQPHILTCNGTEISFYRYTEIPKSQKVINSNRLISL